MYIRLRTAEVIFPGVSPFETCSQHIPPTDQSSRELTVPWCEGKASPSLQLRGMTSGTNEVRTAIGLSARQSPAQFGEGE